MTIKEINDIVNERCDGLVFTDSPFTSPLWHARFYMAEGMLKMAELANSLIEPIENPDKEEMATCYYDSDYYDDRVSVVTIHMGGRQELYKCHTIFFVQLRKEGAEQWETHLTSLYENRFTDMDCLTVELSNAKEGDRYEVRVKKMED